MKLPIPLLLLAACSHGPSDRTRAVAAFHEAKQLRETWEPSAERQALETYAQALDIFERLDARPDVAATLQGIAKTHLQLGDAQSSIEYLQRALSLFEKLQDTSGRAAVLNDLGQAYAFLGQTERSFGLHQKALELSRGQGDRLQEAISLRNIALRHADWAEIEDSIRTAEEAIAILRNLHEEDQLASALRQVGRTYSLLGRMEESFDRFNEALAIRDKQHKIRYQAGILTEIGWNHHLEGRHDKAIQILQQAIDLNRTHGHKVPPGTLDRLGSAYRDANRLDESLAAYQQALQLLERDDSNRAATLLNLAELQFKRGQPDLALRLCEEAMPVFERIRDVKSVAHIHFVAALALRQRGRLAEAQARLEKALQILDSVRLKVYLQAFIDAYQTSNNPYYEAYVDLLMQRHQQQPGQGFDLLALAASERTRALRLEEALAAGNLSPPRPADQALIQQRRQLWTQVEALDRQRTGMTESGKPSEEIEALDKRQDQLMLELDRIQSELNPPLRSAPVPLDPAQIQPFLPPDALLLYYALGGERSFLWLLSSDGIESFVLPPAPELDALARRTLRLFNQAQSPAVQLQTGLYLKRLQEKLLGPVLGKMGSKRLILVPDSSLQYVPFAALPDASGRPLLAGHEISFLPSATTLALLKQRSAEKTPAKDSLALFADPVFNSQDSRLKSTQPEVEESAVLGAESADLRRSARDLGLRGFPRLRFTRQEGESILALFPKQSRFGAFDFAASRDTFLDLDLSEYRILHFATHALLHPRFPELSGIVLSLVDENGRPLAGFVRSQDIAGMRLKADLVVLSACKTAMGKDIPGEGVIGLPQSFMEAGVPGVVVSLWSVSDPATSELMRRFYRNMEHAKLPPAAALRAAQLSLLDEPEWSQPYYWAGFIFLGQ